MKQTIGKKCYAAYLSDGKRKSKIARCSEGRVFMSTPDFYGKAKTRKREQKSNEQQADFDMADCCVYGRAYRSNTFQCKRVYSRACCTCGSAPGILNH
jgi:hypothetical protein